MYDQELHLLLSHKAHTIFTSFTGVFLVITGISIMANVQCYGWNEKKLYHKLKINICSLPVK